MPGATAKRMVHMAFGLWKRLTPPRLHSPIRVYRRASESGVLGSTSIKDASMNADGFNMLLKAREQQMK